MLLDFGRCRSRLVVVTVCSDEELTLGTSAIHQTLQVNNIAYQPLLIKAIFSLLANADKIVFFTEIILPVPWQTVNYYTWIPWVPEATRLLNPAGQRPAKRAWGPKWAKRAKSQTRVASGGEPQRSRYVGYRFCTWSLIGYLKTCFFQRPQLVKTGHVKWTGFFSKTEWCLVEKKCVQQKDFIEGENLYSVSFKIWENYNT